MSVPQQSQEPNSQLSSTSPIPRYHSVATDGNTRTPIKILFTDNNHSILNALKNEYQAHRRAGAEWLPACYEIDYYQGDIVPLALGRDPNNNDFSDMLTNVAFVSPANSKGYMSGGIDYPLNHKMFPDVSRNVMSANKQLAERFYAAQDRTMRDDQGKSVFSRSGVSEYEPKFPFGEKDIMSYVSNMGDDSNGGNGDYSEEQQENMNGQWYGPLFDAIGMAFMPVGSASISPTQPRGEEPNGRNQYLVSAPTMYSPGSRVAGTGNAGAAVFATLGCVQKYNKLLARIGMPVITTIVLPGMGTGVGGMSPQEYAKEAFVALEEYGQYYLGYQSAACGDVGTIPDHMLDLVPSMSRFFLREPGHFLSKQSPDYSMMDYDLCYRLFPRPDPEVERLKSVRPTGGIFGSGGASGVGSSSMFDHQFGMGGFAGAGGMISDLGEPSISGGNFQADPEFQDEIRRRLEEEESDRLRQQDSDEDDLGAEAILLQRMSSMASRRDKIEEEIKRRNDELMASGNREAEEFLRQHDPNSPFNPNDDTEHMSFESRLATHMMSRDEDAKALIAPLSDPNTGSALSEEEARAQFAAMMAARNSEIDGGFSS